MPGFDERIEQEYIDIYAAKFKDAKKLEPRGMEHFEKSFRGGDSLDFYYGLLKGYFSALRIFEQIESLPQYAETNTRLVTTLEINLELAIVFLAHKIKQMQEVVIH